MKVEKIQINQYKSILKPFVLKQAGKLHFFIGANNVGKTNILEALYQLSHDDDSRLIDNDTDLEITFSFRTGTAKKFAVKQKGHTKKFVVDGQTITQQKAYSILNQHMVRLCATRTIDKTKLHKDYETFYSEHPKVYKIFCNIFENQFPQVKVTKELFKDATVHEQGTLRPFERLGDGFQQVFIILMYLFHPVYNILLLEEPEIHLHPALIKKLLYVIENQNLDNQVFLTTHSPIFIQPQNLHRLFRVTKENKSTTVSSPRIIGKRLNYTRLTQELNAENCEMLFADKVLLVEGPSDHILMRGLIDRFYSGTKDIKVIQTYGKSNVDVYSVVLEIYDVPFAILLDRDALYDTGIKHLNKTVKEQFTKTELELIVLLKKYNIFVLPNGSIERNYPRKYQRRRKHKTQNAMYAASRITKTEFRSPLMKHLKEVIDSL